MAGKGISGVAVSITAVGGLLVYAGIRDVPIINGLRDILSGKTPVGKAPVVTAQFGAAPGNGRGTVPGAATAEAGKLIDAARSQLGKPYKWATAGPNTFDCSGLVVWSLKSIGVANVPRFTTHTFGTWAKSRGWTRVSESDFRAGDVVVKSGHMGIAISHDKMIHAPTVGKPVQEANIYSPRGMWWGWRFPAAKTGFGKA